VYVVYRNHPDPEFSKMYETGKKKEKKNKKDKNDKIYATFLNSFGGQGGWKNGILKNVLFYARTRKENQDMLEDAGRCARFEQKRSLMLCCWWHVLVAMIDSSVDVFYGGIHIQVTTNFLFDEFVDKIGVLSRELGSSFLCGNSVCSSC